MTTDEGFKKEKKKGKHISPKVGGLRIDSPRNKLLHSLFSGPSHHRDGHAKSRRRRYSSSVVYVAVKRRVVILVREIFFSFLALWRVS